MNTLITRTAVAALLMAGVGLAYAGDVSVKLTGDQEVPAVTTAAKGSGTISIGADKSVKGSVKTSGIVGTAAHIHLGEVGKAGPPVITLTKSGDDEWKVPDGSVLTDDQYAAFKAGNLYVNIHSAEHKPGEIRAQLKP
jgi:hypothetical protein